MAACRRGRDISNPLCIEEAGFRRLDCAEFCGNEAEIGSALNTLFSRGKVKCEDMFITSKTWNTHHGPADDAARLRRTLPNLQCKHLELHFVLSDDHVARLKARERCYKFCDVAAEWKAGVLRDAW